jgi:PAS domain S-box-containing protein
MERLSAETGGAMFVLDADGRITRWPARAASMTGFSGEEAVGRHWMLLYTQEAVAAGEPERDLALAALRGRHASPGTRLRRGGYRYRAWTLIVPLIDGFDHLAGFCCVLRDHTGIAPWTDAGHEPSLPAQRVLEAISLALGYADILDRQLDPELTHIARRALTLAAQ